MAHGIAKAFLEAIARGETPDELLDAMVAAVLDADVVQLAGEVRAGGEHRWRRAIQLAGVLARGARDGTETAGVKATRDQG